MDCRHILTEADNTTLCPVRVAAFIVGALYHAAAAWGIFHNDLQFDIATLGQYMQHMMTLVGIGGLSVGAKSLMKGDAPCGEK